MYDFIAIGDTVVDEFIRLKEASVVGTPDTPNYKICLPFAEKIPFEDSTVIPAVGNAANAAVSAARLGLKSALITNLGDDDDGDKCLVALKENGVDVSFVKNNFDTNTNYHYVLWYGADRTILTKHESYEYTLPDFGSPKWLYLSSLGGAPEDFYDTVAEYLDTHIDIKLAFQPGKREIKLGKDKLERLYKRADIFFSNVEEAGKILGLDTLGTEELLKRMHDLGPKMIVITDGPKGAYAYDGVEVIFQTPYPDPKPPFERTGAGDAFASTTVAALELGKDLKTALAWASVNSMSVVQEIGAQKGLLSQDAIEAWLEKLT
jgi:sugar/nucleoside kinase (ribokinase family)